MSGRTSVLPAGLTLRGSIEGKGDLVVAGTVVGPIELDGDLLIELDGAVRGDVRVHGLTVRGLLTGDATAKSSIRVESSATVVGDALAPRVNIVEGAKIRGRVRMTGEPIVLRARRRGQEEPRSEETRPQPARSEPARSEPVPSESPRPAPRRRRRRRGGRKRPPPPTIPVVPRQKARRKDRVEPGGP